MSTLLERGMAMLARVGPEQAGGKIRYAVGTDTCVLSATFGRTDEAVDPFGQMLVAWSGQDFIVQAEDLRFGLTPILPVNGARITKLASGEVYEVLSIPGGKCFKTAGPNDEVLRIHAKKVT